MIQSFPLKSLITSNVMMKTVQLLPVLTLKPLNISHSEHNAACNWFIYRAHQVERPMHKLRATVVRLEYLI